MPRSQNQTLLSLVSIQVGMIASTWLQTFSTIVTTVVSPQAKEVSYIEDCSVEIMNQQQEQIVNQDVTSNYGTLM